MLGVSIALWADSWVTNRGDRLEESARLHALRDNITETLEALRAERDNAAEAADALRSIISGEEHPDEEWRMLLRFGILYGAVFSPELNVYDDLKNSGELALLTNRDLRQALATMDSRLAVLQLAQSDLLSVQQLQIDSYAMDNTNLRTFYGEDIGLTWTAVDRTRDLEFVSDVRFQNRMVMKLDLVSELLMRFSDAEAALADANQAIATQLSSD